MQLACEEMIKLLQIVVCWLLDLAQVTLRPDHMPVQKDCCQEQVASCVVYYANTDSISVHSCSPASEKGNTLSLFMLTQLEMSSKTKTSPVADTNLLACLALCKIWRAKEQGIQKRPEVSRRKTYCYGTCFVGSPHVLIMQVVYKLTPARAAVAEFNEPRNFRPLPRWWISTLSPVPLYCINAYRPFTVRSAVSTINCYYVSRKNHMMSVQEIKANCIILNNKDIMHGFRE